VDEKLSKKLRILADAAKYDASCASSGAKRKTEAGGLGSTTGPASAMPIRPDGRCVSLLKILLTNYCLFDCAYCVNRRSSNVRRARFSVDEVVTLTIEFYKRNYIEGLFCPRHHPLADYTMEQLLRVAKTLRRDRAFGATSTSRPSRRQPVADRAGGPLGPTACRSTLSFRRRRAWAARAEKDGSLDPGPPWVQMHERIAEAKEERRRFSPAGQSTQVIVGADATTDAIS
jgi:predicted DNA-binding helix-hairpin-helix protein